MIQRVLAIGFFLFFGVNQISGQVIIALLFGDKLNNEKISFGLNAGANYGTINNFQYADSRVGINFGLYFNLRLSEKFDFAPELIMINDNGARDISKYSLGDPSLDKTLENTTINRRLRYASLPLIFNYNLFKQLRFGLGPQVSFLTDARDNFWERSDEQEISYKRNIISATNRWDIGLIGGFTYRLMSGKGLFLRAYYYFGFLPVYKSTSVSDFRNQYFQFSVGIPVGATNKKVTE
jgi:hypothetical protein